MKKYLIFLLLPLLLGANTISGSTLKGAACGAASELTCSRSTQQAPMDAVTRGSTVSLFRFATTDWAATEFLYTGTTGTLCSVDVALEKDASPTGTITMHIYNSTDSTSPNVSLGTCGTLDASTLTDTSTWYTFSCDITITNGTTYWVVLTKDSYDGTNFPEWGVDGTAATTHFMTDGNGVDTWSDGSTTVTAMFRLYIKE